MKQHQPISDVIGRQTMQFFQSGMQWCLLLVCFYTMVEAWQPTVT